MEETRNKKPISEDTEMYKNLHLNKEFMAAIHEVKLALQEAGFDPYDQLTGYVKTGNDQYITRRRNARAIVTEMDPEMIKQYLKMTGTMARNIY